MRSCWDKYFEEWPDYNPPRGIATARSHTPFKRINAEHQELLTRRTQMEAAFELLSVLAPEVVDYLAGELDEPPTPHLSEPINARAKQRETRYVVLLDCERTVQSLPSRLQEQMTKLAKEITTRTKLPIDRRRRLQSALIFLFADVKYQVSGVHSLKNPKRNNVKFVLLPWVEDNAATETPLQAFNLHNPQFRQGTKNICGSMELVNSVFLPLDRRGLPYIPTRLGDVPLYLDANAFPANQSQAARLLHSYLDTEEDLSKTGAGIRRKKLEVLRVAESLMGDEVNVAPSRAASLPETRRLHFTRR